MLVPGHELQAAVFHRSFVNAHHHADEKGGVIPPAGLGVLVGLEAVAAGHLEIDLLLEQDGFLAQQL